MPSTTDRDDVLAAAGRHLNAHPAASMGDLAAAAGIGRATLHRHFASREALLHELGERSLDRWDESQRAAGIGAAVTAGDAATLRATLRDLLERFVADSDDFGFALTDTYLLTAPGLTERAEVLFDREIELYAAAQRAGVLRPDVPARWIGRAVYGLLVAARDALVTGDVARRDLDALVRETLLDGLGAPEASR